MKRNILLLSLLGGLLYFTLTSYTAGIGYSYGVNCTNGGYINPSTQGCGFGGSSCHNASVGNLDSFLISDNDNGNRPVTGPTLHWIPGHTYSIELYWTAPTSLKKYGFQCANSIASAGKFLSTYIGSPSPTYEDTGTGTLSGYKLIESNRTCSNPSGKIAAYFSWQAPDSATTAALSLSADSFFAVMCAVNGDSTQFGDTFAFASKFSWTRQPTAVENVINNIGIFTYPNPVGGTLYISLRNTQPGTYGINVFDLSGRKISTQQVQITGSNMELSLNTSNWASGLYQLQLSKDGAQRTMPIVKQ